MEIPVSIHDAIMASIAEKLSNEMILSEPDEYLRPSLIRPGLLQANPVKERISLLIYPGDIDDLESKPVWSDTPATKGSMPGWEMDAYEIGGGEFWFRRFTIDVNVYLTQTKEDRSNARALGLFVNAKAHQILHEQSLVVQDGFGETSLRCYVNRTVPVEGGGPPNSFIWRGKIFFSVLTEKTY